MSPDQAAWVDGTVLRPRLGKSLRQPQLMGQQTCLHLAEPVCTRCSLGYHSICTGASWPELHETWICDSHSSWLYWADGDHYRVWTPPRRCACLHLTPRPTAPAVPVQLALDLEVTA